MKVYIVTSGVYSDYQIEGVFSAEKYASIVPDAKRMVLIILVHNPDGVIKKGWSGSSWRLVLE